METIFLTDPAFQESLANILILTVVGVVGGVGKAFFSWLKANTSAKQFAILQELAAAAVKAAEQGQIAGLVNDRKATAINIVNEGLQNAGIKNLSAEQVEAAIESAVLGAATEFADAKVARAEVKAMDNPVPEYEDPDATDTSPEA